MEQSTHTSSNSQTNIIAIVGVVAVWVILSVIVYLNADKWFMAEAASVEADAIDGLFKFMMGIGTFIFLLVQSLLFFFLFRYGIFRDRKDTSDGPPIHGNNAIEITWTLIPAFIVFILTIYSFQVLIDTTQAQDDEFVVNVLGQRFFWEFNYPNPNADEDIELAAQHVLVLPANQSIRLNLQTIDVMHAFWVPQFRVKQDLLPGRTTELRFTPNQVTGLPDDIAAQVAEVAEGRLEIPIVPDDPAMCPAEEELTVIAAEAETEIEASEAESGETGEEGDLAPVVLEEEAESSGDQPPVNYGIGYPIVCAELCGGNHGLMRGEVFVVEQAEFDAYMDSLRQRQIQRQRQQELALFCGGAQIADAGRSLFMQYGCNTCHQLVDAGSNNMGQGPSLNAVGARALPAGYADHQDYIRTSIVNPNAYIVDGYPANLMPQNYAQQMTPDELDLLVAYLTLQTGN